jgi:poly(A) polymerase
MSAAQTAPGEGFGALLSPEALRLLTGLSELLDGQGVTAWLVGGFIRDVLLGRPAADIDIAVAADPLVTAQQVAATLGGKFVRLDTEHRTGRVILPATEIDFSPLDGTIEADLARRDFTIDALAWALNPLARDNSGGELIDPHGGARDLEAGIVRVVSPTVFRADGVRLLRAVRLAAELDFTIDPATEALLGRDAPLVTEVAGERVREELLRQMHLPQGHRLWGYIDRLGLLTALIPELTPEKGVGQPREHYWDVFEHSLMTIDGVDYLLRRGDWEYGGGELLSAAPWSTELSEYFDSPLSGLGSRRALLKLAALLHDIAKPQTKALQPDGRTRFLGHAPAGAATAAEIMTRLRFSGREIKYVTTLIEHRPTQMSQQGMPSRRAIYRYFRDTGEAGVDILFLSLADHLATRGPTLDREGWREHARLVDYVLEKRSAETEIVAPPRLLDGHDLIKHFGLEPGPQIGRLLAALREAQAAGEIGSREEALAYIGRCLEGKERGL